MSLAAHDIVWHRGKNLILDRVSVAAQPGDTIGILGPNGSGKSSLISILAGVTSPDSGDVTLGGSSISNVRRRTVARKIAVVDQHAHTEVDISVLDVVRLGRIPHRTLFGSGEEADDDAIDQALADTGMISMRRRLWHTLSGGERQRAQIARALAQQPDVLLLDEPTNHLDISHQLDILSLVSTLPVTSYIALHDLNVAAMFCDRLVVLERGRVVASGTPVEVLTEELVEQVYRVRAKVTIDPDDGYPSVSYRPQRLGAEKISDPV